jgi:hypothetical protein
MDLFGNSAPALVSHESPAQRVDGYNPMRWNCTRQGCFNVVRRPKIELFADCFPGKISFGDIDGMVEIGGHFLILEWKSCNPSVPRAQHIMYEHFVRNSRNAVVVVFGNAETMEVMKRRWYYGSNNGLVQTAEGAASFEVVHNEIAGWHKWAMATRIELVK